MLENFHLYEGLIEKEMFPAYSYFDSERWSLAAYPWNGLDQLFDVCVSNFTFYVLLSSFKDIVRAKAN